MKCGSCGKTVPDNAEFCNYCGKKTQPNGPPERDSMAGAPAGSSAPASSTGGSGGTVRPYVRSGGPPPPGSPATLHPNNSYTPTKPANEYLFAILTVVAYLVMPPVGLIMNVVGLFTGPKRGCFVAMIATGILAFILIVLFVVILESSS
jgi:hypothetical protein